MSDRYVCLHGHFYQPPRENPWLESVERQDSALPYHDWNQRVTAECYAPNAASRILDEQRRIVRIVNNYSRISFNFGPTLLSWMERNTRFSYDSILKADRLSQDRFGGHGSALAQAHGHLILPLANSRDKETQVLWGIRDFEHRFGRSPDGMWLAETAVDLESLDVMAANGIRFTVLAPHQAKAVRPLSEAKVLGEGDGSGGGSGGRSSDRKDEGISGGGDNGDDTPGEEIPWQDVSGGRVEPSIPYRVRLPSGRSIVVFFYDGGISRAVAFEDLLENGERLADRLLSSFPRDGDGARLVHIATDGETYGHHHVHGEMALSYALERIEEAGDVELTNYSRFLEEHPPRHEAQIVEQSSWSCSHGVERWRSDCGCSTGSRPGWNQAWRRPLRQSLDFLRDKVIPLFEDAGGSLLTDPWAARNDYIRVLLDRSPETLETFFEEHAATELSGADQVRVRKLMELQRHAMLMFTSCGWFFSDLSGIETVQVLLYAGRVVQLTEELFDVELEEPFLKILQDARSNLPERGNGRQVYQDAIRPARVDLKGVAAHYALRSLFGPHRADPSPSGARTPRDRPAGRGIADVGSANGGGDRERTGRAAYMAGSERGDAQEERNGLESVYCYSVSPKDRVRTEIGRSKLHVGWAEFRSDVTGEFERFSYAALHAGDHNLVAGIRAFMGTEAFRTVARRLEEAFTRGELPEVVRILDREFGAPSYSLRSLFRDEQQEIVDVLFESSVQEAENVLAQLYRERASLMRFGAELGVPQPRVFQVAAEFVLDQGLREALGAHVPDIEQVELLLERAREGRVELDPDEIGYAARKALERVADQAADNPDDTDRLRVLEQAVDLLVNLDFQVNTWGAQNSFHRLLRDHFQEMLALTQAGDTQARSWVERVRRIGEKLLVRVP